MGRRAVGWGGGGGGGLAVASLSLALADRLLHSDRQR